LAIADWRLKDRRMPLQSAICNLQSAIANGQSGREEGGPVSVDHS
jgi:hypothetical protein